MTPGNQLLTAAGVVSIASAVAALATSSEGSDLRSGPIPWSMAALAAGIAAILLVARRFPGAPSGRLAQAGIVLAAAGLCAGAAMLLAIGVAGVSGSDALDRDGSALTAVGTLAASVSTLLLLPVGLLGFSIAMAADRRAPLSVRAWPVVATAVTATGPVLIALVDESGEAPVLSGWLLATGLAWVGVAVALRPCHLAA